MRVIGGLDGPPRAARGAARRRPIDGHVRVDGCGRSRPRPRSGWGRRSTARLPRARRGSPLRPPACARGAARGRGCGSRSPDAARVRAAACGRRAVAANLRGRATGAARSASSDAIGR